MKTSILVTGATGYVGRHCATYLSAHGYDVLLGSRHSLPRPSSEKWITYGCAPELNVLKSTLRKCQIVVHCAGQNQVSKNLVSQSSAWSTNVNFTRTLAELSADAGVQHFIFISSALVVAGARDAAGRVGPDAAPSPMSAYAQTKWAAEQALAETSAATGLQYTILRPPMVYGPEAKGNFARLAKLARSGLPLPLGGAIAAKSFIFVDNLASAITAAVARTPPRTNSTFLVSDGDDTSTADLLREIAMQANGTAPLFRLPHATLKWVFISFGLREEWEKLFAPFVIDSKPFSEWANWTAPVPFREAIRLSVAPATPRGP